MGKRRLEIIAFQDKSQGFSLTEMAIVLGIIGFILAAIWTAYSVLIRAYNVTTTAKQVAHIVNKIQNIAEHKLTAFNPGSTIDSCIQTCTTNAHGVKTCTWTPGGFYYDATDNMEQMGIFPSDMTNWPTSSAVHSLWPQNDNTGRGDVVVNILGSVGCDNSGNVQNYFFGTFKINYGNLPVDICTRLLWSYTSSWQSMGLSGVCVSANRAFSECTFGGAPTTTPATMAGWCAGPQSPSVDLGLTFPLRHP